jgi:hypothetical protein
MDIPYAEVIDRRGMENNADDPRRRVQDGCRQLDFPAVESSSHSFNGVSIISFGGNELITSVEGLKSETRKFTPWLCQKALMAP